MNLFVISAVIMVIAASATTTSLNVIASSPAAPEKETNDDNDEPAPVEEPEPELEPVPPSSTDDPVPIPKPEPPSLADETNDTLPGGGLIEREKECPKGEYDNNGKCTKIPVCTPPETWSWAEEKCRPFPWWLTMR